MRQDRATLAAPGPPTSHADHGRPRREPAGTRTKAGASPARGQASTASPLSADQLAIRRVLDAYQAAYGSGNVKALQAVQVLIPAAQKAMAAEFARGQHLVQIDTEDIRVSADGRSAVVNARSGGA